MWIVTEFGPDGELLPYRSELRRCQQHRSSRCRPCAARYRSRVQTIAHEGLRRPGGHHNVLTLTAPSEWVHCKRRGCDRSDCVHEKCRCTPPGGLDLAAWNASAGKRWNRFLVLFERRYGERPQFFRAVEAQKRGAIHYHVPMTTAVDLDKRGVRALAVEAGFGHEIELDNIVPGSRHGAAVARYVAKYVTKATDTRAEVPWQRLEPVAWDEDSGEVLDVAMVPCAASYRTWSQSRGWGPTMKLLREVARRRWLEREAARVATDSGGKAAESGPAGPGP